MKPRVTIIVPCFNAELWIEKCVSSALSQTYENIEVIVIDNESTDNSLSVIERLAVENTRLIIGTAPNIYKYSWEEPLQEALKLSSGVIRINLLLLHQLFLSLIQHKTNHQYYDSIFR